MNRNLSLKRGKEKKKKGQEYFSAAIRVELLGRSGKNLLENLLKLHIIKERKGGRIFERYRGEG